MCVFLSSLRLICVMMEFLWYGDMYFSFFLSWFVLYCLMDTALKSEVEPDNSCLCLKYVTSSICSLIFQTLCTYYQARRTIQSQMSMLVMKW